MAIKHFTKEKLQRYSVEILIQLMDVLHFSDEIDFLMLRNMRLSLTKLHNP
nr:hypothetical protein Iba_chr04bCG9870 [Ipomoea batatas]